MPRPIDAIALCKVYMDEIKKHPMPETSGLARYRAMVWLDAAGFFITMLTRAPTIEAEPVRHGRWVNIQKAIIDTTGDCTNCGQEAVWRTRNKPYAICPNCGCKMDVADTNVGNKKTEE